MIIVNTAVVCLLLSGFVSNSQAQSKPPVKNLTSDDKQIAVLKKMGYQDPKIGGFDIYGCSEKHAIGVQFSAVDVNNKIVYGVLCDWNRKPIVRSTQPDVLGY